MAVIRFEVAYDGAPFHGWQVQPGSDTIQGQIERALSTLAGHPVSVNGASRNDAGVHALGQVVSLPIDRLQRPLELYTISRSLNALLPRQISVLRVERVDALDHRGRPFHARHCARGKIYRYSLWLNRIAHPHLHNRRWNLRSKPDEAGWQRMYQAADLLLGEHDFAGFRASSCDAPDTLRQLYRLDILRDPDGCNVEILVHGSAFLKNMVRIIVGTLVDVGLGAIPLKRIQETLDTGDRRFAGQTAPPQGLCLEEIFYPDFPWTQDRWSFPTRPPKEP